MFLVKLLRNQRVCISINPGYVQQNEQKWCFALCMYMYVYWLFVAVGSRELIHPRYRFACTVTMVKDKISEYYVQNGTIYM